MPSAAPRPCTYPGCRSLVRDGSARCGAHVRKARQESDAQRGTAHERGYSAAWQRARAGFLRSHPLCMECTKDGSVGLATVVDHVVPHKGDTALFWDSDNWQGLCKPHHDRKTATEDGGFGNQRRGGG